MDLVGEMAWDREKNTKRMMSEGKTKTAILGVKCVR